MIKVDGNDNALIWWDPETNKYFIKMDCNVAGIDKTLTIEAEPEWFVELYKTLQRSFLHVS